MASETVDDIIQKILNGPKPLPITDFDISKNFTVENIVRLVDSLPAPKNLEFCLSLKWIKEEDVPFFLDSQHKAMLENSKIIDGVRMLPYYDIECLEDKENDTKD